MKVILKKLNVANSNGIIYSTKAVKEAIDKLEGSAIMGQAGTAHEGKINLSDLACMGNNIAIEDDNVVCDITMLETPMGKVLSNILSQVEFTLAGTGVVGEDGQVSEYTISYISVLPKDKVA